MEDLTPASALKHLARNSDDPIVQDVLAQRLNLPAAAVAALARRERPGPNLPHSYDQALIDSRLLEQPAITTEDILTILHWHEKNEVFERASVATAALKHADIPQVQDFIMRIGSQAEISTIHRSFHYPTARFEALTYRPEHWTVLRDHYEACEAWEAIHSLSENWTGTVGDLLLAAKLVQR